MERMLQIIKSLFNFIKTCYSEPSGNGSSTRIHIGAIFAFVLGVGVSFSVLVHKGRITIDQFNQYLSSGGTFILTTAGPLYGVNKAADWAKNKNQNQVDQGEK